jgi:predicted O-linked N-acetylglucosamine transferase (SPINDLY family)
VRPIDQAVAAHQKGNLVEAESLYRGVLAVNGRDFDALHMLGVLYAQRQQLDQAASHLRAALAVDRTYPPCLHNYGKVLAITRRSEEAIEYFNKALKLMPNFVPVYLDRGNAQQDLGRFNDAVASYDQALKLQPDFAEAWHGRANALRRLQRYDEALAAFDRALALNPRLANAWHGRGLVLFETSRLPEAVAAIDKALSIEPNLADAISGRIFMLDFAPASDFEEQQSARRQWWQKVGEPVAAQSRMPHVNARDPDRRIRVGYVSADFRGHSAALGFGPILFNHNKSQFEVSCYSSSDVTDETTRRFQRAADRWHNVARFSDDEVCHQIRADQIDILIDLSGHSLGNRLGVFASKPAPIQVTAWGHATGTGLRTIDYLFSDPIACPPAVRHLFAEKIFDLPCFLPIEPLADKPTPSDPPVISEGYITFGVFNRANKVSDVCLALWSRILRSTPRSRILLKNGAFEQPFVRSWLLNGFAAHGVSTDRISILGATSRRDHLAAFNEVDISLDPFPQNGGISTWESLQVGVPVVARLGKSPSSRAAAAILASIGLDDWISDNDDGYFAIATKFAGMAEHLKALRRELPQRTEASAAGNCVTYTKAVESAYRAMWVNYCSTGAAT